ncbi:coiled-coil domain-containing protein 42 homolog [Amphiura filiformis]|uniref:coiled-coil domain-containing protein 42 homolog n=1 Tax=Amphiura filiformis TaxID=82378 RepID=UPI003B20FB73
MAAKVKSSGSYRLELEAQKQSVFVTQLGEREDEELPEEDVNKYPIVKESAGKLIETGLNTLQKTLLLKREVEVEKVSGELQQKRNEFQKRMELCEKKRVEIQRKQQQMKERVNKFDKFIKETEAKRRRAIHKYQTELKLKEQKQIEYEQLLEQLAELKQRHKRLCEKLQKYKKFEDYLMKVLDGIPENYLEVNDSMLRSIMDRHRTLSATNKTLKQRIGNMYDKVDENNQTLEELKYTHDQKILVINKQLSELQSLQEERLDANAELEEMLFNEISGFRDQSEILGRIKMAIHNIAAKCWKKHDGPMDSMELVEKLDLIMLFTMEKIAVERMVRLETPGTALRKGSRGSAQGEII